MPPKKSVPTLVTFASGVVSEHVWNFLLNHSINCKYFCKNIIPMNICPIVKKYKHEILMPVSASDMVLQTLVKIWKKKRLLFNESRSNQLRMLIYHLMLQESSRGHFALKDEHELHYSILFGMHFESLSVDVEYSGKAELNEKVFWTKIFRPTVNLLMLDLKETPITESLLESIGHSCHKLREIQNISNVSDKHVITDDSIRKFCFKDFPLNYLRNPCCFTLQVVDIYDIFSDLVGRKHLQNSLLILIDNIPHLRSLGFGFNAEEFISHIKSLKRHIRPTSLEIISSDSMDMEILKSLILLCPNLQKLSIEDPSREAFLNLHQLPKLSCLCVYFLQDYTLLKPFLETTGKILTSLTLAISQNLDLTHIINNCPRLTDFNCVCLDDCNFIYKSEVCFERIKYIHAEFQTEPDNYEWIKSVAGTIQILFITCNTTMIREDIVSALLEHDLPCLEDVFLDCMDFSLGGISALAHHCPNLVSLGLITDPFLEKTFTDYIKGENWKLDLY